MARPLAIMRYGDTILRGKNEKVSEFGSDLGPFFKRMWETLIEARGVGLAAPQVGVSKQIAIINPELEDEKKLIKMVNPRIVAVSKETDSLEEGCLSVPGVRGEVVRAANIKVVYQDENGSEHMLDADGFLARIIQHEIDHLNGVLFIDRLSFAKRALLKGKLKELADRGKEK
jgi:peptide deformylase